MKILLKLSLLAQLILISTVSIAENYVIGQLIPLRSVTLSSEILGVVDEFSKDVGDKVEKGQVLVNLSIIDSDLTVELAKATLKLSKSELEINSKQLRRYKQLFKLKDISISELDEQLRKTNLSESQFNINQIQLRMALRQKEKSQVKVPFSGVILTRNIELGQLIPTGQSLYSIVDTSQIKVRFHLLESDVIAVKKGDAVNVIIPALNNKLMIGTVVILAPAFQSDDPGFLVEVLINNNDELLKAGMQARVELKSKSDTQ